MIYADKIKNYRGRTTDGKMGMGLIKNIWSNDD